MILLDLYLNYFILFLYTYKFFLVFYLYIFYSYFQMYPEKFYFEGLRDLNTQNSQHAYLPVYFGNVCLRFLPVSNFLLFFIYFKLLFIGVRNICIVCFSYLALLFLIFK